MDRGLGWNVKVDRTRERTRWVFARPERKWWWVAPTLKSLVIAGLYAAFLLWQASLTPDWLPDEERERALQHLWMDLLFVLMPALPWVRVLWRALLNPRLVIEVRNDRLGTLEQTGPWRWGSWRRLEKIDRLVVEPVFKPFKQWEDSSEALDLDERARTVVLVAEGEGIRRMPLATCGREEILRFAQSLKAEIERRLGAIGPWDHQVEVVEAPNPWFDPHTGERRMAIELQPQDSLIEVEALEGGGIRLVRPPRGWRGSGAWRPVVAVAAVSLAVLGFLILVRFLGGQKTWPYARIALIVTVLVLGILNLWVFVMGWLVTRDRFELTLADRRLRAERADPIWDRVLDEPMEEVRRVRVALKEGFWSEGQLVIECTAMRKWRLTSRSREELWWVAEVIGEEMALAGHAIEVGKG
jgi:hypothetical protein